MKLNILKRAGMLAASTAVCCGVVFGGLSMNGLRYVRPTAENWTLLAYMQPAARIEQQKTTRVIPDEKEWSYLRITGYDAQNREIWSLNCKRPFGVSSSERKVYSGSQMTWYSTTCGVKTVSYTEYDEQGRIIRTENANGIETYTYRGDEEEPYLEQSCDTAGNIQSQTVSEYNPKTGETTRTSTVFEGVLTGTWITVKDARGSTLHMENDVHDPNYEMMQDNEWTYDDTERTAVGMTSSSASCGMNTTRRTVFCRPAPSIIFLTLPDKSGNLLQIPNVKYNAAIRKQRAQYPKQRKNH